LTSFTFYLFFIPILAIILLAINFIFATYNPNAEKRTAFECGFHSFLGQNRSQFSISFFIFALLFLLFDLEILLIYPYALSSQFNDIYGLIIMLVFFVLLTIGFIFELGKKALVIYSRQNKIGNPKLFKSNIDFLSLALLAYFDDIYLNLFDIISKFNFFYIGLILCFIVVTYILCYFKDNIYYHLMFNKWGIYFSIWILILVSQVILSIYYYFDLDSIFTISFSDPNGDVTSGGGSNSGSGSGSGSGTGGTQQGGSSDNQGNSTDVPSGCPCDHDQGGSCLDCNCIETTEVSDGNYTCCICGGSNINCICNSCDCTYHDNCLHNSGNQNGSH
jgi:NADH-ubiquinone oxidoreductase chain 3